MTPLFLAICNNEGSSDQNLECVKLLLDAGADLLLEGDKKLTALHHATNTKQINIVKVLLSHAKKHKLNIIDAVSQTRETALHIGAEENLADLVQVLLENSCNYKAKNNGGETALLIASKRGFCELTKILLQKAYCSTIEEPDSNGYKPIHWACLKRHSDIIILLVTAGCDLSSRFDDKDEAHKQTKIQNVDKDESTAMDLLIHRVPFSVALLTKCFDSFINLKNGYIEIDYKILLPNEKSSQLKTVEALIQTGNQVNQKTLLAHPLIESFLFLQWKRFRNFYYLSMISFIFFVVPFTALFWILYSCSEEILNEQPIWTINIVLRTISCFNSMVYVLQECARIYYSFNTSRYIFQWSFSRHTVSCITPLVGRFIKIVVTLVVPLVVVINPKLVPREVITASILLFWVEMMLLGSRLPLFGFYMLLFFEITPSFLKAITSFTFLLVGFVVTFYFEFQANPPFESMSEAIMRTMVMMTNEFEYEHLFDKFGGNGFAVVYTKVVFLLFLLLVGIVLVNIVLAKAISDIQQVDRLRNRAVFLSSYEYLYDLVIRVFRLLQLENNRVERKIKLRFTKAHGVFNEQLIYSLLEIGNKIPEEKMIELSQQKLQVKNLSSAKSKPILSVFSDTIKLTEKVIDTIDLSENEFNQILDLLTQQQKSISMVIDVLMRKQKREKTPFQYK